MPDRFVPRLDVLPAPQRRLWPELGRVPEHFAVYGGTGLALHLGHRQSVDFDLFSLQAIDPDALLAALPFLSDAMVTQRAPNTLGVIVDRDGPVRVSFFGVPALPRLAPVHVAEDNGLAVASLLDLAGTKASVVQVRSEARDYLDIEALVLDRRIDLPTALAAAAALYGPQFNPQITLKALSYFGDGNLRTLAEATQRRLAAAAAEVDLDHLPDLAGGTFGT
jgi:hypothetical protein